MKTRLQFLAVLMWLAAGAANAQTYTIRTLGPAPDNTFFSSTALAINNKSEVLVSGVIGLYDATPSLYLPVAAYGLSAGLNYLPFFGGSNLLVGTNLKMNDNAELAGRMSLLMHAGFWQPHSATIDLGNLGGDFSQAVGVNNAGQITGQAQPPCPGRPPGGLGLYLPFLVKPGETKVSALPGFTADSGGAIAINNQRRIIGYYGNKYTVAGFTETYYSRQVISVAKPRPEPAKSFSRFAMAAVAITI